MIFFVQTKAATGGDDAVARRPAIAMRKRGNRDLAAFRAASAFVPAD